MSVKQYSTLFILTIISFSLTPSLYAQFYYKDVWNTMKLNTEFSRIKNENIHQISTKSYEDDGSPSTGFYCEKKIDKDYNTSILQATSYITGTSTTVSRYNDAGQIIKVTDSSNGSVNTTTYDYDRKRLKKVTTITHSKDAADGITETHEYSYNSSGQLEKMTRKKNGSFYSDVFFTTDKNNNIIEERENGGNSSIKTYYYYYNDKNKLTDVVHKSQRLNILIPDYAYEYDKQGQPVQLITTEEATSNYFTWIYQYDERNLRIAEQCFSKEKRLLGTVKYYYK